MVGTPSKRLSYTSPSSAKTPLKSPLKSPVKDTSRNRDSIKVIARFRPEAENEKSHGSQTCHVVMDEYTTRFKDEEYQFDRVFDSNTSQKEVFDFSVSQTVDDLFDGYNGTVLVYGQTGSGKTYTMMGPSIDDEESKGIIPRIADAIFERISQATDETECTLSASYMEIYMEQIRDLLSGPSAKQLTIHEDGLNGVHVRNLNRQYLGSNEDLYRLLQRGSELRAVASTDMNVESSRSHAILQIDLTQESLQDGIKRSKLFLVDLAGSEKVGKTGASGQTLEEAKKINSSLSSLGNVISALTDSKSSHVPYRDSKLTRILQESLGGNSKTSLIINCSPSSYNESETISTLRFGSRAKKIKNKAHVNAEPSQLDMMRQIEHLTRLNQDHELKLKEMSIELDLWRTGVNKLTQPEPVSKEPAVDEVSSAMIHKVEYLENRLRELTAMLGKCPSFATPPSDTSLVKQLEDSQTMNNVLLSDLESKCLLIVDLQTKLDSAIEASKKATTDDDHLKALHHTLEQFTSKINNLEEQNHQFVKEIQGLRSIAQTRADRIKALEKLLEGSRHDDPHGFDYKFFSLRERLSSVRTVVPNPPSVHSADNNMCHSVYGDFGDKEGTGGCLGDLKPFHTDVVRDHDEIRGWRRTSTSSGPVRSRSTTSSRGASVTSGGFARMGLLLNVVKPTAKVDEE